MSRRSKSDPVEQFFLILVVTIIVGVFFFNVLANWVIYTVAGVLLAAVAIGIVLRLRAGADNQGGLLSLLGLNSSRQRVTCDFPDRQVTLPVLGSEERATLIEAVGGKCENPHCRTRYHQNLQIHHIVPRNHPRSTNKLENLLVLCPNCHSNAGNNQPGRNRQQLWARNRYRFVKYYLVRNWDWTH